MLRGLFFVGNRVEIIACIIIIDELVFYCFNISEKFGIRRIKIWVKRKR